MQLSSIKKRLRIYVLAIACVALCALAFGQTGRISGKIVDQQTGNPVEYATIALHQLEDSMLVTGSIAAEGGQFGFERVPFGTYYLKVRFMGYRPAEIENVCIARDAENLQLGQIEISKLSISLDAVHITTEKTSVEYKIDRKVINVSEQIIAEGGNATDAIKNLPSVETSLEGDIKLRGSANFTLLIDGKPTLIDASDLLKQLPASAIDKIEIITNPSAKYDPDGTSGIINVVLKKDTSLGLSVLANLSIGTGFQYSGNITLSHQAKKFAVSGGLEQQEHNIISTEISARETYSDGNTGFLSIHDRGNRFNANKRISTGLSYYLGTRNTISLSGSYNMLAIGHDKEIQNHVSNETNETGESFLSKQTFKIEPKVLELNIADEHWFDDDGKHRINFNLLVADVSVATNQNQQKYATSAGFEEVDNLRQIVVRQTEEDVRLYDTDLDYQVPLTYKGTLEAGIQIRSFMSANKYNVFNYDSTRNKMVPDSLQSNVASLSRDIYASYMTVSYSLGKWQAKLGARLEYTNRVMKSASSDAGYDFKKLDFYPSAYLSRSLSDDQQIQISYSRRINRPQLQFLNPVTFYSDGFTSVVGNPYLKPDYTNSFEINYSKPLGASYLSVETYFRQTNNKITRVQEIDEDGAVIRTMRNLNKDRMLGLEVSAGIRPAEWLEIIPRANWYQYHLDGKYDSDEVAKNSTNWRLGLTGMLWFNSKTKFQLNVDYESPTVTLDGKQQGLYYAGMAIQQSIWKERMNLTLRVEDIFNTRRMKFSSYSDSFYQSSEMYVAAPMLVFSMSYKLNKPGQRNAEKNDMSDQFNIY
jgi:outer membrane receptor protein involved in Fe transport